MGTCGTPNRLLTTLHVLPLAVRTCPAAIKQRDSLGRKVAEIRILWTVAIRTLGPNLPWTGDSLPAPRPAATFALGASAGALFGARGAASARPGGILAACGTYVIARCWHRAYGCPRLTAPRGPGPLGPHPSPRGRGSWSLGRYEGRQRASAPRTASRRVGRLVVPPARGNASASRRAPHGLASRGGWQCHRRARRCP